MVLSAISEIADDLFEFANRIFKRFAMIDVEVDMDRCGAAMGLDACAAAPFFADNVLGVRQMLTQVRFDDVGVAGDIAVSDDDGAAFVNDVTRGVEADYFGPFVDAANFEHRVTRS